MMAALPKGRDSVVDQDRFLAILPREDALERFEAALFPRHVPSEQRRLSDALGRALTQDVLAPLEVSPFDCSNVDGFAVRSADLARATGVAPVRLTLNDEEFSFWRCARPVCAIRNSDANCNRQSGAARRRRDRGVGTHSAFAIDVRRAASPGQFVSYAGSDIARGEVLLRAGTIIGSRPGSFAACGIAEGRCVRVDVYWRGAGPTG